MVSRVENRLDDVKIANELQYYFVYTLKGTISYINVISSVDNGSIRDMTT